MSIHSSAFGGVTLTGRDAEKFVNQIRYGRPKKAASETVKRGSEAAKTLREEGRIRFSVTGKKSAKRAKG